MIVQTVALAAALFVPPAAQQRAASPVAHWSHEARRAIVPPGPGGVFGAENYGNVFPGEAALYMGIVHAAMYDAAVALDRGYRPYAATHAAAADASPEAAIATAAHHTLSGLQSRLGLSPAQRTRLDREYAVYLARIPDGAARTGGVAAGKQAAEAVLALRANDGSDKDPRLADLGPPAPGAGVWDPGAAPALGLRLPGVRPLALESASQFRPGAPAALGSAEYADDFEEVRRLGGAESASRTAEQTAAALFWTDHDLRQWNDGLLGLAAARGLDLVQTARLLAMAHVAGGDAMLACFDAKYAYWFWRPYQAIPRAQDDGNPATGPDPAWRPLRATPNFPEYPSAHACHSAAMAEALRAFFGTDEVPLQLDSRVTRAVRRYARVQEVIDEIDTARVASGFHFRSSDRVGARLGRQVGQYVVARFFRPVAAPLPPAPPPH